MFERTQQNLPMLVYMQIQKLIVEGKLKKGDRLPPERELAVMFKVSRNSLRETLGALAIMGIIQRRQGGYNVVSAKDMSGIYAPFTLLFKLNGGNIFDVVYFRYIHEIQALKMICGVVDEKDCMKASELLEKSKKTQSIEELLQLDIEFHKEIIRLTGNKLMYYITDLIYELIEEQLRASYDSIRLRKDLYLDICQSHESMLNSIIGGDTKAAITALTEGFEDSFPALDFEKVKKCI